MEKVREVTGKNTCYIYVTNNTMYKDGGNKNVLQGQKGVERRN